MRAVTARRKLQTAAPLGVKLTSGSSVRLPTMLTWVSGMAVPSSGLLVIWAWLVAVVVRSVPAPPSWLGGSAGAGGVGVPVWSATGLASCLLVGLSSSPAPGDRVSPGRVGAGAVKAGRRPSRRDARNGAQRVPQRP